MSHLRRSWMILVAAVALLMAGLACNAITGPSADPTARPRPTAVDEEPTEEVEEEPTADIEEDPTEAPEPTEEPTEEIEEEPTEEVEAFPTLDFGEDDVLFEDTFDENSNGWDEDGDDTSLREFRDGVFSIQVFNTVWFAWANPVTENFDDVLIQVTVSNVGGQDPAYGVICSYVNADAFYFMGFGDDGYYGIGRIEGDDFVLLSDPDNRWRQTDDIELFQDAYELEAECHADGTLRLIVDGVLVDEVQDDAAYGAGGIGLFVQSFDNVPVDVEFDDLVVTPLSE